jgi:glycosyltransferase involved in cell wall biosynthesis
MRQPPIRIVRIIDRLNIGGPAKHVTWLAAGLDASEFQTTLVTGVVPDGEGDMSYFAEQTGVTPLVVKQMSREIGPRDFIVTMRLLRLFFKLRPQIIHTHKSKAGAAGRLAAALYRWATPGVLLLRPRRCRVVHTYHGHIFHSYYGRARTRLFIAIERMLARFATDRIIVLSEGQRREIAERFRVGKSGQFHVIPLGIDLDESRGQASSLRAELGATDDEVLIGIVGRLCEVKNHEMFIEAAARLSGPQADRPLRARFVVIGDGHLRPRLEARARDLGLAEKIIFTGFRPDVASLYSGLDIVAVTSLNEGTPLGLIEAMSAGRAVASTEVGGVGDILGERQTSPDNFTIWDHGVSAPSRETAAFADGLRYLIERPALRREMGERGREFVEARLSKQRLIRDIEQLYRGLANGEKQGARKR